MDERIKRLAKRVVSHPENTVPTISSAAWTRGVFDNPAQRIRDYIISLFPIATWITRYNVGWVSGDLVAGLTVGMVVVPQGMSYAQLALLPAEYGLYTSFVGVLIYCFFATSKDVSIGPVAVMSIIVSQVIKRVEAHHPGEWDRPQIATVLSFVTGFIVLGIGILRLGWIVEFIPAPAVSGFMTGSAISIAVGQLPGLLGIAGVDTRTASYKVVINTLKGLSRARLDAAWGLVGLVALYAIRYACIWAEKRNRRRARVFFFISVLRNAFVIIILTLAAWLYCRHRAVKGKYPIKILLTVPAGFKHVQPPKPDPKLLAAMAPELPVATIILLLEHIAISKSFGRLNGYKIDPNQELIAIGVTGIIGSCLGAYPATGSFSRSALKSKSGVRTPLAGVVTAMVVVVALYGLTDAFFWIPTAGLSAIIIHNVIDLAASPSQVYSYWRVSPLEFLIWATSVLLTVFSSIEIGIYASIGASLVLLLLRVARPRGSFLGKAKVHTSSANNSERSTREIFLPLAVSGIKNCNFEVLPPSPGVIIYRFEESCLYPNCSILNSVLVDYVKKNMRRGRDMTLVKLSDRPWNDPGPRGSASEHERENKTKPILRAIVLDFSTVSHIDTTAIQALVDARREIEIWADHTVEFHFSTILSPWIKRALIAGGFGFCVLESDNTQGVSLNADDVESDSNEKSSSPSPATEIFVTPSCGETPFFHVDLFDAVAAAERGVGNLTSSSTPDDVTGIETMLGAHVQEK